MLACRLRWLVIAGFALTSSYLWAAEAEEPIYGGLGVVFGTPLEAQAYGAEIHDVPESALPANRSANFSELEPGTPLPWRYFNAASLPRPLRKTPTQSFVMMNEALEPMRVISRSEVKGCGDDFDWLKATLTKKYQVQGDAEVTPEAPYERNIRIVFLSKQIEVRCGPRIVIDYMDTTLIRAWANQQTKRHEVYRRDLAAIDKRRMVMHRRQAIKFADTFTLGDQFRLEGAFGIQFQRPFAKNSTQKFPVDEPFYAVLPDLPSPFDQGDIQLVISPEKHPIVIRGTFHDMAFDDIAEAFKAKYGYPMKTSPRHIIHKISGNHAILKKMSEDTIEVAFIDTNAQKEQRERLRDKESEGL